MNRTSWIVTNFAIFLILLLLAAAFQSSLLHWLIGWRATIQIVLVIFTYICLYRAPTEALVFTVLAFFGAGLLSNMLESLAIFSAICVFLALRTVRARVYSSNPVHFTWTALGAIFGFHFISWLTAEVFEPNPPRAMVIDWILEVLLTALFVRLFYASFIWLDRKTKRLTITELNS
jgi:hypothetical protein